MEANSTATPNPPAEHVKDLLSQCRVVAVVGLSPDPGRDSHRVAAYLQQRGYRVIPVNPQVQTILGQRCYPDLAAIPEPVDIVDVFRASPHAPEIARQAVAKGAKCLWLQQGVRHEEAAAYARVCGLTVVQDRCIKADHQMHLGYAI